MYRSVELRRSRLENINSSMELHRSLRPVNHIDMYVVFTLVFMPGLYSAACRAASLA